MRIPTQKLLPVAVGIVFGCLPVIAYSYWYDGYIERLGRDDVQANADRAIAACQAVGSGGTVQEQAAE